MIDTASALYNTLLSFSQSGETTICHSHKPCKETPRCSDMSVTAVLDFDSIELQLATGHRPSLPSCDGVALNNAQSVFCFVEIKGWEQFIVRNIADTNNLTENDKTKIDKQTAQYDLKGKLEQSIKDCEIIANQNNLFPAIPYAYVIVTDINSNTNALDDLYANLSNLAETASVWTYCDDNMRALLNSVDITVKKVYAHCRDFDYIMSQIG